MATFIFANNVNTTLASAVSGSATTITLSSSANLPASIPAGSVLVITLNDAATKQNFEIMYATAISGATLTVTRAQEGTAAQSWIAGDAAFSGPTAGQMANFSQGGASGVTPGSYGSSTQVGQFTVNSVGQITAAANVAIAFPITSFNGRAGAIVLNSGDVTTALGYNPVNKAGDTMTGQLAFNGGSLGTTAGASVTPITYFVADSNNDRINLVVTRTANGSDWTAVNWRMYRQVDSTIQGFIQFGEAVSGQGLAFGTNTSTWATMTAAGAWQFNGAIACSSTITATQNFASSSPNVVLGGGSTSGSVFLRPQGISSATGQAVIDSSGDLSISGTMNNQTSDQRVKTNFVERDPQPSHHLWWGDYDRTDTLAHGIGHKAQSVRDSHPHHVHESKVAIIPGTDEPMLMLDRLGLAEEQGIWCGRQIDQLLGRVADLEVFTGMSR